MDFTTWTLAQLEARAAEILAQMADASLSAEALSNLATEARGIQAEREARAAEAARAETRAAIAAGAGTVVAAAPQAAAPQRHSMSVDSAEYRDAFLRTLNYEELEPETRAAFVATTGNTTAPLPTTMVNQIWDLVSQQHSILGDVTVYRTGTILEIVKHTAIEQGAAKVVAENAANDDEKNTFVKVTLSGKDFSKHVDISYAFGKMALPALEQYLVSEIGASLGDAMAADVITQITGDMTANNKATTATAGKVAFKDIAATFAKLKRADNKVIYASEGTVYNYLVSMEDASGRPLFQPNLQAGAEGTLLGATIKKEDAVADGVLLLGDPKKFVYNIVQDVMIESDRDIKKHVITHSGYARAQGVLVVPTAFAQLTVKVG